MSSVVVGAGSNVTIRVTVFVTGNNVCVVVAVVVLNCVWVTVSVMASGVQPTGVDARIRNKINRISLVFFTNAPLMA